MLAHLFNFLNQLSPFELQAPWDNSGINLGHLSAPFDQVVISLEATLELALELPPKTCILAHHPLFFKASKNFNPTLYPYNIATPLIQKSCSLIALHTNFDITHLNAHFANLLGFENLKSEGFALVGAITPTKLENLLEHIQERLQLPYVRYVCAEHNIEHIAIVCGAGASYLQDLAHIPKGLCLITGDVKHHDAMAAKSMGVSVIDVGHYESEKYFVPLLHSLLATWLQTQAKHVRLHDCKNPFHFKGMA
ncbi:Nif3-like dinuclear metal center hexameric protein [Helicobacter felis]|uniref:Nif3-like dinuclear metal center hexameric protein n=1 Tax=Helicobacter felis TaxID=214 RepID=UPI000CF19179|nr:Nif3-like dinuclear metal center hexameric protein [Helicobacter felis]